MGVLGTLWDIGDDTGPVVFDFPLLALGHQTSWLITAATMAVAPAVLVSDTWHTPPTATA